jgi:hypothetical protein
MKKDSKNKEIIESLLDSYLDLLINNEEEADAILREENVNIDEFNENTRISIGKLERNAIIKLKLTQQEKSNWYQKAVEIFNSMKDKTGLFSSLEADSEFTLAYRNLNSDNSNVEDLKKELALAKIIKDLQANDKNSNSGK